MSTSDSRPITSAFAIGMPPKAKGAQRAASMYAILPGLGVNVEL